MGGGVNSNKGVQRGAVSSAGTPTGQARVCTSLLHAQPPSLWFSGDETSCKAQTAAAPREEDEAEDTPDSPKLVAFASIDGAIRGYLR